MSRIGSLARDVDRAIASLPPVLRWPIRCSGAFGVVGGVVGLVLGLAAHPPTAWFAVAEVGVPAAILGLPVGAVVGLLHAAWVRLRSLRR